MSFDSFTELPTPRMHKKLILPDADLREFNSLLRLHDHDLMDLRLAVDRAAVSGDYCDVRSMIDIAVISLNAARSMILISEHSKNE